MVIQLTGSNRNGSPELSLSGGNSTVFAWSPFGGSAARTGNTPFLPGFNGERQDPLSGVSHLGNGYRAYSPALHRFTCPDSESPFGGGGINPYVYCDHDPVNNTDPSGHSPITGLISKTISLGVRQDIKFAEESATTALATAGTVETGTNLATQGATGISAQIAKSRGNVEAASELGWASMGMGGAEGGIGQTVKRLREPTKTNRDIIKYGKISNLQVERATSTENGGDIANGIEYFIDEHDFNVSYESVESGVRITKPRLNIAMHGEFIPAIDKSVTLTVNGRRMTAKDVADELQKKFGEFHQYSEIRTIICHSAESSLGGISLGQQLSNLTRLPVESFHGSVSMYPPVNGGYVHIEKNNPQYNYKPHVFYPQWNKSYKYKNYWYSNKKPPF